MDSIRDLITKYMFNQQPQQGVQRPPVEMAGPQGTPTRNAAELVQMRRIITELYNEGRDQEAAQMEAELQKMAGGM